MQFASCQCCASIAARAAAIGEDEASGRPICAASDVSLQRDDQVSTFNGNLYSSVPSDFS